VSLSFPHAQFGFRLLAAPKFGSPISRSIRDCYLGSFITYSSWAVGVPSFRLNYCWNSATSFIRNCNYFNFAHQLVNIQFPLGAARSNLDEIGSTASCRSGDSQKYKFVPQLNEASANLLLLAATCSSTSRPFTAC